MSTDIKPWTERVTGCGRVEGGYHGGGPCCGDEWYGGPYYCATCQAKARDAEIADLRAALYAGRAAAQEAE